MLPYNIYKKMYFNFKLYKHNFFFALSLINLDNSFKVKPFLLQVQGVKFITYYIYTNIQNFIGRLKPIIKNIFINKPFLFTLSSLQYLDLFKINSQTFIKIQKFLAYS